MHYIRTPYNPGYAGRGPFFFGPFLGGVLGGLVGGALARPRPFFYPPVPTPFPPYGYGYGYGPYPYW